MNYWNTISSNTKRKLTNEKNNNIPFGSNSEVDIKYNGVETEEKYNNMNYNDLSKQLPLE
ncbi:hypothetical protein PFMG_04320 [Plasmodium falciparum IGH-CR14]|uniref:Uncharacterized protein n=1 Tax=Plasmodium falciparum IGH-CR14 TaxID=580059 RepID=A0A0L1IG07_PLAFA|nr:hypothetical protein PFMG_04320 [Plasmodium falciparum IGH-CR14]